MVAGNSRPWWVHQRGASSDAQSERKGLPSGRILPKGRGETAKSLPVCKTVSDQMEVEFSINVKVRRVARGSWQQLSQVYNHHQSFFLGDWYRIRLMRDIQSTKALTGALVLCIWCYNLVRRQGDTSKYNDSQGRAGWADCISLYPIVKFLTLVKSVIHDGENV